MDIIVNQRIELLAVIQTLSGYWESCMVRKINCLKAYN